MVLGHEHLISNTNVDFYKLYKPKLQRQLGCLETVLFENFDNVFLLRMHIAVLILTSVDCKKSRR